MCHVSGRLTETITHHRVGNIGSDSPIAKKNDSTPKLRMVPKSRFESLDSLKVFRKGEQAMQELMEMCKDREEERDSKIDSEKAQFYQ